MGVISDYFARRRLRPVLRQLPHVLAKRYGAGNFYTAGQVRSAVKAMKLHPKMVSSAFALGCETSEFLNADPTFTQERYRDERREMARLSGIDERDLNCGALTTKIFASSVGEASDFSGTYPVDGSN
jgi:hypothetical protein